MEISNAFKIPRNRGEPAQSDSIIDLDLLLEETCAAVREDVRKIKQSERDHASSAQGKKIEKTKRDRISSIRKKNEQSETDGISSVQGKKNKQSKRVRFSSAQGKKDGISSAQGKKDGISSAQGKNDGKDGISSAQGKNDGISSAQGKKNEQSKRVRFSSAQGKKDDISSAQAKKKDAKKLKLERGNTDINEFGFDPLSKSKEAKVAGKISEEEKRVLKQQYLVLEAASRRLALMKEINDIAMEILKENPAFKN